MKSFHSPINKSISLFLAFIITAGTLTAFFPSSSSVTDAYALSDVKKDEILCNNINFNLNGLDVDAIPKPLGSLLQDQGETKDAGIGTGDFGNGEDRFGYDNDSLFICKNNNNNTFFVSPTPLTPLTPPTPSPCETTVDTITEGIGVLPISIAYDSENLRMYVTNSQDNTVSVIDTNTNTVIDTIDVGNFPSGIAYDSENLRMYVTNTVDGTVSVINTNTNTMIDTIDVGDSPSDIAYDSENLRMYVTNTGDGTVSVIDTTTNTVDPTPIPVGNSPLGIAYDSENLRMYVTNSIFVDGTVSVIDTTTNTVIDTDLTIAGITPIPVGSAPERIAYDSINERMYVTNNDDSTVSVIDTNTNTVISTIPVGANPSGIAYDFINQTIYVGNSGGITVSVIDTNTNTVIDTIPVENQPSGLAFDSLHMRMYVINFDVPDQGHGAISFINLCPRPAELQQLQSTNDIIMTTSNNNNDHTMIKNIIQHKYIPTKDITINNNIIEQEEEQKLADEQKIQQSNVMSPPSLPKNIIPQVTSIKNTSQNWLEKEN